MPGTITIYQSVKVANGNQKESVLPGTLSIVQDAIGRGGHIQEVGTSDESLDFGDVSTHGWLFLRNLDETNYVEYGPDASGMVEIGKLEPGETALFRMVDGTDIKAKANTAACLVDVRCYED